MRSVFLRAVLLGALAALALVAIRARAETAVIICTSATEPSPLRIEREQRTVAVEDVTRATTDLYPLSQVGSASLDALLAQLQRDGKYQCRPGA